jgi:hypothetical protein
MPFGASCFTKYCKGVFKIYHHSLVSILRTYSNMAIKNKLIKERGLVVAHIQPVHEGGHVIL